MSFFVRQATIEDIKLVLSILCEAARWLEQENMSLWTMDEISPKCLFPDITVGLYYIAFCADSPAGVVRFQLEDQLFWDDIDNDDSAFIHRLAVRRKFAGGSVSIALLNWAVERAQKLGKRYLRLDCAADRQKLRSLYEKFGFIHHSNKQVGAFFVARYEYAL
jgi:GNAT superfamily N-acetyltransferase